MMHIITHLYVVEDSWNFEIFKQFWNILWIFKVLEFHTFKIMSVFWVWLIFLNINFFSMKILLLYESFW